MKQYWEESSLFVIQYFLDVEDYFLLFIAVLGFVSLDVDFAVFEEFY